MLATATITYDLANLVGLPHYKGTSVTASTNIPGDTVVDTDGNKVRLGSGRGTIDANGKGSVVIWVPGTGSNPASWQTYLTVRYRDPRANGGATERTFGPFTITGNADLADLVAEQEVPPNYAEGLVAEMTALRDETALISGLTGEDAAVAALVNSSSSDTKAALSATFAPKSTQTTVETGRLSQSTLAATFATVVGVPSNATAAQVNALIQSAPIGATLWFPPVLYTFTEQILVNRSVNLRGSWGLNGTSDEGTRFNFTDATMTSITDAVKITADYATLEGIVISGSGKVAGSSGIRVTGQSTNYTHGVQVNRCRAFGFDSGLTCGAWSDHVSARASSFPANNHGVTIGVDNHHDMAFYDCLLDGNTVSSVRIEDTATTQNLALVRTHLGFSQYGIYQPTRTSGGIDGLTMLGSPIEYVSQRFMHLHTLGNADIRGGYWIWNGTPANAAVTLTQTQYGPVTIEAEFNNTNASCPAIVEVTGNAAQPVRIVGKLGTFAAALKAANTFQTTLTPTLPASFTYYVNNLGYDCMVYISGGTVTSVVVGLSGAAFDTGLTSGAFLVRNGDGIRITYSVAPTWKWAPAH